MSWANGFTELALQFYYNVGTPTRPNTFFLSQHTASPGTTGTNEAAGNGYERVQTDNWQAGTAGQVTNSDAGETPLATTPGIGNVSHWGIFSAATGGTYYCSAPYTGGTVDWATDRKLTWQIGDLTNTFRGTAPSRYSDASMNAMIQWLFNVGAVPSKPAVWHVSFHHADPGQTGVNEFSTGTGNYGRSAAVTWKAGTSNDGQIEVNGPGTSPTSTAAWSNGGNATHFGLWDAPTGGNYQTGGLLDTPQLISGSGQAIQWDDSGIIVPMLGV